MRIMQKCYLVMQCLLACLIAADTYGGPVYTYPAEHVTRIASDNGAGKLFIVGGGTSAGNMRRFMELCGGMTTPLVFIPTASIEDGASVPSNYTSTHLDMISIPKSQYTTLHTWDRSVANSDAFVAALKTAKAVWFAGGLQRRLSAVYLGTKVQAELIKLLERGGVIGGSSAGASIQSDYMIGGGSEEKQGLGFLLCSVADQHINARDRDHRLADVSERALSSYKDLLGIGISEATAVLVEGTRLSVEGSAYVYVWDYKDGNNRTYMYTDGGAFNLADRTTVLNGWPYITFSAADLVNYQDGQNTAGSCSTYVKNNDKYLRIWGNQWKALPLDYTVTAKTILEFDFYSNVQGEQHAIGLDNKLVSTTARQILLYGTDAAATAAVSDYQHYFGGNSALSAAWCRYRVPLGRHYAENSLLGQVNYLFFINDDDANEKAVSVYRNICLYEAGSVPATRVTVGRSAQPLQGILKVLPGNTAAEVRYATRAAGQVQITVHDAHGCLVQALIDTRQPAGSHRLLWQTDRLTSGAYFLRVTAPAYSETVRFMRLK